MNSKIALFFLLTLCLIGCSTTKLHVEMEIKASRNEKEPPPGEIAFFFISDEKKYDTLKDLAKNPEENKKLNHYIKTVVTKAERIKVTTVPENYVTKLQYNESDRDAIVVRYPFFFPNTSNQKIKFDIEVPEQYQWVLVFYRVADLQQKQYKHKLKDLKVEEDYHSPWFSEDYCELDIFCDYENECSIEVKK